MIHKFRPPIPLVTLALKAAGKSNREDAVSSLFTALGFVKVVGFFRDLVASTGLPLCNKLIKGVSRQLACDD
jgi:divalent metal cation (Fe/Co/Zn/Cd) transporter